MLFAVISGPSIEKAKEQLQQVSNKVDGIELRLDQFEILKSEDLLLLAKEIQNPFILTFRKSTQGGNLLIGETERFQLIQRFCDLLKPDYVDLEFDTDPQFIQRIAASSKIICSYHDFEKTSDNLEQIFALLPKKDVFAFKIATFANSTLDALRMLLFVRKKHHEGFKITGICMGEKGSSTRILAPLVHNFITYGCIDQSSKNAPGQLTISDLNNIYHYSRLSPQTLLFGLIGDPIVQSPSYLTHNAFFQRIGLNAVYVKLQVSPDELGAFFPIAKSLGFTGLSVTIPLKEVAASFVDFVEPHALEIGAINTISFQSDGTLYATNTDASAALDCIEKHLLVRGKSLLLLGAGGTAKAIAYEAKKRGAHLIILNRHPHRAALLANALNCDWGALDEVQQHSNKGYDILINATSEPDPINPQDLLAQSLFMDINLHHQDTLLLKRARELKCEIVMGYEMFIRQAQNQFAFWSNDHLQVSLLY